MQRVLGAEPLSERAYLAAQREQACARAVQRAFDVITLALECCGSPSNSLNHWTGLRIFSLQR